MSGQRPQRPQRPMDPRLHAAGLLYHPQRPKRRPHGLDYLNVNWSGYPVITPGPEGGWEASTVAEIENYYVHGVRGKYGSRTEDLERTRELGMPISGDCTARFLNPVEPGTRMAGGGWQYRHLPEWCGLDRSDSWDGAGDDEADDEIAGLAELAEPSHVQGELF